VNDIEYSQIAYEVFGPVARISHNRPERRNAEGTTLLDELDEALSRAEADDAIRVVIVGAKGDHFSAGHDVKEAMGRADVVETRYAYEEKHYLGYCLRLWDFPKPTIAQVQGVCIAGGFMVANMCDLVVASEDAAFSDPVCGTLAAAATEVLIHPWVLGLRAAKDFLYTGRKMYAAYRHGQSRIPSRLAGRADLGACRGYCEGAALCDENAQAIAQPHGGYAGIPQRHPGALRYASALSHHAGVQGRARARLGHDDRQDKRNGGPLADRAPQ
jgi:enoyl-CoA hydratase